MAADAIVANDSGKHNGESYISYRGRKRLRYVPYEEIEKWFQKDVSSKGKNRGLGLFHAKNLCQEQGCDIACRNIEYEQNNWIEFSVEIKKANSL